MKISHSTLLSWSLVACGSSSAFAFSTSRSRSPHRTPRAVAFTTATGTSRVSTGPQSSTTRLNDIKFLIDTPLTEDETIRMAEMDEIQKVKEFISWLDYKTPEKTKAGTPKASSSGAVSSGGAFIGTGDIAADAEAAARIAREDAISASTASATDDHGDDVASTPNNNNKELPRLRTTLGSTVLLTGIFEKQSNSNYEPLLFNLLNANSLTEDSPSNFKFDSIVTLVNEDKVALPLAKKKAMSRESRYSGLMDKLSIKSSGGGGGIPTKEEMTNVSSWIMHISKEESSTVLPQVAELIKGGQLASLNNVVILMDGVTTKEKEEEVCNEWNVLKGSVDGPDDDGVKCTLVAVGELYDGDGNNLYHVGKLGSEATATDSAVATEDAADTTIGDASTGTAPPSIPSAPKLSRKEAYRIAAHSLALESTVNQALMVYQRDTIAKAATKDDPDATNANADIFLDPIEKKILAELDEKYPYPEFQPMTSDEFIEHNKKTYKIQEARKVARAELEAQYGIEKDSMAKAEEKNEKAKQVKFPGDDILEDRLIMAMREMAFSRTMELDVLVEKGVKAYKNFIINPPPTKEVKGAKERPKWADYDSSLWEAEKEKIQQEKDDAEASVAIKEIAFEWSRRKYWENEINGDLMLYDPIVEKEFTDAMEEEAMAFAKDYYYGIYKMGKDVDLGGKTDYEKQQAQEEEERERRERIMFDKAKKKIMSDMDEAGGWERMVEQEDPRIVYPWDEPPSLVAKGKE